MIKNKKEKKIKRMTHGGVPVYDWAEGYCYVKISDIPEHMQKEFNEWLYGQTRPSVKGVEDAVYSHDWERYHEMKVKGKSTYFD